MHVGLNLRVFVLCVQLALFGCLLSSEQGPGGRQETLYMRGFSLQQGQPEYYISAPAISCVLRGQGSILRAMFHLWNYNDVVGQSFDEQKLNDLPN